MGPTTALSAIELSARIKSAYASSGLPKAQAAASVLGNSELTKVLKNQSLAEIANVARVEPIAFVDADCLSVEALSDLMQTLHSMFSAYYLQAVNMFTPVGGVTVAQRLAPFNPTAGGGAFEHFANIITPRLASEAYRHKLPLRKDLAAVKNVAFESSGPDREALNTIREATNLSVGKIFNVNLGDNVVIPVAIRLMVNTVPSRNMVQMLGSQDVMDQTLNERIKGWRSGRLGFWDLVLCNDLVDKRVRSSISDPTGLLATVRARQTGNNVNSLSTGKASVANAVNLAVISSETAEEIEAAIGGPIKNSQARKALFESTNLMLLAIVNKHWERVTFWTRGQSVSSTMSYRDLKASAKDGGSNVADLLKAYISGASL